MAALSIGTHLSPLQQFKKRSLHSPSLTSVSSLHSLSSFDTYQCRIRGPRLLGNGVLARAEDKARESSSSIQQEAQQQPNNQKQFQELESSSGTCDPLCSLDETSSSDFEANYQPKTDLLKALAVFAAAITGAVAINHSWVAANQDLAMALLFGIGYTGIIFEESLAFNKSGVGLLMAVSLWIVRSIGIGFVTFFLSSILDNLTSTIVMVSLLRKLVPPSEYRKLLGAVVVIAANAGGAWTPIGDVTTTMLWIHGQISTLPTMKSLFIPSAVSLAVPLAFLSLTSEVNGKGQESSNVLASEQMAPRGQLVFAVGIGALIFVPVFKALTGLPPYMGILLGLGVLWILTDAIHYGESERQKLKVPQALSRIDTQGALFFLGILLSVSSLEAAGLLREIANYLDAHISNIDLIASAIGVVSAVIDNVPLVAATMGMYDLTSFPQDSEFWQLIAYCAGTGGSMLIIGSAAGVAFMGMEKVDFFWYLRKVSGFAFAGYATGIAAYLAVNSLHFSLPTTLAQAPFLPGS
ncbi:Sodium/proton antiporter 1 [Citrus sinensis]|uniref:sodium/proton antiporter 1 isoform X2 n=1 Tax=Citrus sinensis TaxID=2711 RepID=UPI00219A2932|nr:sodium/proton antiporter 1 isoform X2 [Citrus sinensis]KAH9655896.1 Sodium/proton antiporter 1 [Citrus sinensis]